MRVVRIVRIVRIVRKVRVISPAALAPSLVVRVVRIVRIVGIVRKVRVIFPSALARTSLVLWRMEPPPGRAWGYAPQTRSRSKTCTSRKLLKCNFPYAVGPPESRRNGEESRFLTFAPFHVVCAACHGAAWRSRVRIVRIVGIVRKVRGQFIFPFTAADRQSRTTSVPRLFLHMLPAYPLYPLRSSGS